MLTKLLLCWLFNTDSDTGSAIIPIIQKSDAAVSSIDSDTGSAVVPIIENSTTAVSGDGTLKTGSSDSVSKSAVPLIIIKKYNAYCNKTVEPSSKLLKVTRITLYIEVTDNVPAYRETCNFGVYK